MFVRSAAMTEESSIKQDKYAKLRDKQTKSGQLRMKAQLGRKQMLDLLVKAPDATVYTSKPK